MIQLTRKQRLALKPYQEILTKVYFNATKTIFVDHATTAQLAQLYKEITGHHVDCKICPDKSFIKRLSFWYCNNRNGILPDPDK